MDISFATMGAGVVHTLPLPQLLATLKAACPVAESYSPLPAAPDAAAGPGGSKKAGGSSTPTGTSSLHVFSLAASSKLVESFPGPLNGQASKDRIVKFVRERLAACVEEERLQDAPTWQVDGRRALWELLLLMAQHHGQLKVCYSGHSGGGAAKAAAGLLKGAVTAAAGAAVAVGSSLSTGGAAAGGGSDAGGSSANASRSGTPTAGPGADAAAAAAPNPADSELLRILLPDGGGSLSAASGWRVLAVGAPEVELQATAAEMQVCVCGLSAAWLRFRLCGCAPVPGVLPAQPA
jgi:hypothetical protein